MSPRDRERRPAGESDLETEETGRAASLDRALLDWRGAQERVTAYLSALGFEAPEVRRLGRQALERALGRVSRRPAVVDAMDEIPRLLLETHPLPTPPLAAPSEDAFLRWRLSARSAGRGPHGVMPEPAALAPTPPLVRGAMTSERFLGRRLGEWRRRGRASAPAEPADPMREERRRSRVSWGWRGRWRRALLAILVVVPSVLAGAAFLATLPAQVWLPAEIGRASCRERVYGTV